MAVIFVLLFWGVILYLFFGKDIAERKYKRKKEDYETIASELKDLVTYDLATGTMYLHKKSPRIREIVNVDDDYKEDIRYEPEKLKYGSATVGGVTTGEIYKTGGYNYSAGYKKTGHAMMLFGVYPIRCIRATDELMNQARKTSIRKYIGYYYKHESIEVIENWRPSSYLLHDWVENPDSPSVKESIARERQLHYMKFGQRDYVPPTFEKCEEIIRWMCN